MEKRTDFEVKSRSGGNRVGVYLVFNDSIFYVHVGF